MASAFALVALLGASLHTVTAVAPTAAAQTAVAKQRNSNGLIAAITEDGYQQVAGLKSDAEMTQFMVRVLQAEGVEVNSTSEEHLSRLAPFFSGTVASQSLGQLRFFLLSQDWVKLLIKVKSNVIEAIARTFKGSHNEHLITQARPDVASNSESSEKTVQNLARPDVASDSESSEKTVQKLARPDVASNSESSEKTLQQLEMQREPIKEVKSKKSRLEKEHAGRARTVLQYQNVKDEHNRKAVEAKRKQRHQEYVASHKEVWEEARRKAHEKREETHKILAGIKEDAAREATVVIEKAEQEMKDRSVQAEKYAAKYEQIRKAKEEIERFETEQADREAKEAHDKAQEEATRSIKDNAVHAKRVSEEAVSFERHHH